MTITNNTGSVIALNGPNGAITVGTGADNKKKDVVSSANIACPGQLSWTVTSPGCNNVGFVKCGPCE
jgi:hypothetical protein